MGVIHFALFLFLKAVLQGHGAVEDKVAGGGVLVVHGEIAGAEELEALGEFCILQSALHLAAWVILL